MITRLLSGLGVAAPILLLAFLGTLTVTFYWVALVRERRRFLLEVSNTCTRLGSAWDGDDTAGAIGETRRSGLGRLIDTHRFPPGYVRTHFVDVLLSESRSMKTCRKILDILSTMSPLAGLICTVAGVALALAAIAINPSGSLQLSEMAGPTSLALRATIGFLLVAGVAEVVPGVINSERLEERATESFLDLHDRIHERLRRERTIDAGLTGVQEVMT